MEKTMKKRYGLMSPTTNLSQTKNAIRVEEEEDFLAYSSAKRLVRQANNHIYFYDEIDDETQLLFVQMFARAEEYLSGKYRDIIPLTGGLVPEGIHIHINSPGGDAYCSLAIHDLIKDSMFPVFGEVEGRAASGATLILCGCQRRTMTKNSAVLCHELRGWHAGKWSELKDDYENSLRLMDIITKVYKEDTKIPSKEMEKLLEHDIYWNSDECLKYGLVDEVVGAENCDDDDCKEHADSKKSGKKKSSSNNKKNKNVDAEEEKPVTISKKNKKSTDAETKPEETKKETSSVETKSDENK